MLVFLLVTDSHPFCYLDGSVVVLEAFASVFGTSVISSVLFGSIYTSMILLISVETNIFLLLKSIVGLLNFHL